MSDKTAFNSDAIKESANRLGSIMDDMSAFDELKPQWPNAGHFDTAQWLERVVDDRRNGVVAHAERLKIVLNDLKTNLTAIAEDFTSTDGDNAGKIKSRVDTMESTISSDVTSLSQNTENEQHNFSGGPEKPEENNSDGDGYDDVLKPA
ncbi:MULTISPECIES: hypothetical protein [Amycolatopsis]|uniref:Excreted virulence factor EspC, type VII ESX diderm n=2 Tax=Amycolatopsis TaxID=1813 RepID=A0A1I3WXG9_9PSEU|nr:hypothetical protein [Amycolatopsis sacchari]SFK12083.1 hypothetical protein SAMN05421835_11430 [Amycolatopsis sacchari]